MDRLQEIKERKLEIRSAVETASMEELDGYREELDLLEAEEKEIQSRKEIAHKLEEGTIVATVAETKEEDTKNMNIETMEYRKAFMNYVVKGEEMPAQFRAEAMTSDNQAVIPTVILDQIVTKLTAYGDILPRVKRTAFAAGFVVPSSALAYQAKWQNEGAAAEVNGGTTGSVTFSAYQLRCTAGVSFKMHVQSLAAFEALMVSSIAEAMGVALENAIINGSGVGQPKGILKETAKKEITVDFTKAGYKDLINIIKAIPAAYKSNAVLVMNENTALDLLGIVDKQGQPVARMTEGISGAPVYKIMGKEVILSDAIADVDTAQANDIVIAAVDLQRYVLNTAYDVDLVQFVDNSTRSKVYDSVMLVDGKMVDSEGLVFVKKK